MASKKFGDTLRDLRKAAGYTQQQAADLLGLKNKSTLGSWEVGKSEPDGYTFLRLLKVYQVRDIYEAFGEISPSRPEGIEDRELIEKYNQLNEDYKQFIDQQITFLLEIQERQRTTKKPLRNG